MAKSPTVTQHTVQSGHITLAAYTCGNPEHTPVVLVHGYPDDHSTWDNVVAHLAKSHYVITYDVRGAGNSDRPKSISDYSLEKLSNDLVAVLDTVVPDRAVHLVGHDWGSIQTWESVTAPHLQNRILSYTTLSGPCLDHVGFWMKDRLFSGESVKLSKALKQLSSSWYIMAFQLPFLAPLSWKFAGQRIHKKIAALEKIPYVERPQGAEDGVYGVNLYRANFLPCLIKPRARRTNKPVQLIVLTQDNYVGAQLFEDITTWAPHTWRRDVESGHWTAMHEGKALASWIADFIAQVDGGKKAAGLSKLD